MAELKVQIQVSLLVLTSMEIGPLYSPFNASLQIKPTQILIPVDSKS